jgi:tRNA pseudouridine32 synthase/23S rRNA pseudouridine746 synthase
VVYDCGVKFMKIKVIYTDPYIVVIEKPSGLLAVPGRGADMQECVVNQVKALFPSSIEQPSVHRLDMDTSGLMVLGLRKKSHRELSIQFQNRLVKKKYLAILDGFVSMERGIIELKFRLDVDNRPYQIYDEENGKFGITEWKKIDVKNGKTLIEFTPITGRTHQLRLHSSHAKGLGIPIVGDRLYGTGTKPGELKLHSSYLEFLHPITERKLQFSSTPPFLPFQ